jgi:hypothetical protein
MGAAPADVPGLTSWEAGSPPMPVAGVSSAVYVATNEGCSCALLANSKIMC